MSAHDNSGPAFPASTVNHSDRNASDQFGTRLPPGGVSCYPGMTLRDYFAAKAMQGWLASFPDTMETQQASNAAAVIANFSYTMADAMLKARAA